MHAKQLKNLFFISCQSAVQFSCNPSLLWCIQYDKKVNSGSDPTNTYKHNAHLMQSWWNVWYPHNYTRTRRFKAYITHFNIENYNDNQTELKNYYTQEQGAERTWELHLILSRSSCGFVHRELYYSPGLFHRRSSAHYSSNTKQGVSKYGHPSCVCSSSSKQKESTSGLHIALPA